LLRDLEKTATEEALRNMTSVYATDGNGTIEWPEFLAGAERNGYFKEWNSQENMRRVFNVYDKNGDDFISLSELKLFVRKFDVKYTDEEVEEMLRDVGLDNDGQISYEEAKAAMTSKCKMMVNVLLNSF